MHILNTIQKYKMLTPHDHILIAVSGGADSLALTYGLLELQEIFSLALSVCHINHNLRGEESDADSDFVKKLCSSIHLPFYLYSAEINPKGTSLEEAARQARYRLLAECAKKCGANKIATGHNQNDNAETLLLRLCRGTGLSGLCGIPPVREESGLFIIRPLIETPRNHIEVSLRNKNKPYRTDSTNFDRTFARNRVRRDILPAMEQINQKAAAHLAKTAEMLREDEALLESITADFKNKCVKHNKIHIPTLIKSPKAMQKRIIRAAINDVKGTVNISQTHIAQIENLLLGQTGKEVHLPGDLRVRREYDYLFLFIKTKPEPDVFCFDIPINEPVFIPPLGHYIQAKVVISCSKSLDNSTEICTKYFNYDKINGTLKVRTRLPGDRINFAGVGSKKLKKEFSDRKIPKARRDSIPLLAVESDILWIMDSDYGRTGSEYAAAAGHRVLAVEVFDKVKETVSVLISEEAIRQRVSVLADEINKDYAGCAITMVCALKGAMIFMADLARKIKLSVDFDFVGTSSYGDGQLPGKVRLTKDLDFELAGKHILLIEDILDTGHTLTFLRKHIMSQNPASFKVCCLLDKPDRRVAPGVSADYTGFSIPDSFVVGYGLDYAQRYRNLPYIGTLAIQE